LIRSKRRRLGESRSGDQKSQQRQSYSDRLHLILYSRRTADARAILPVFCSMSRAYFLRCRQLIARPKRRTASSMTVPDEHIHREQSRALVCIFLNNIIYRQFIASQYEELLTLAYSREQHSNGAAARDLGPRTLSQVALVRR
jgi:hypothetical protein